jgi:hypothetical protein
MRQIFFGILLLMTTAAIAQTDASKDAPKGTGSQQTTPSVDHSHDAVPVRRAEQSTPSVDHSHDAVPAQHTTTTAPAAQPAKSSAHPVRPVTGKEAAHTKTVPARAHHDGPTAVSKPSGAEAAHTRTAPARPKHSGPTPVNKNRTERDTKSK